MAKDSLSIDDLGRGNPYDDIPTLTKEQALFVVAEHAYNSALLMWGEGTNNPRLTINDRIAGAVYSTFELLQNGVEGTIPPFALQPLLPLDSITSPFRPYVELGEDEVQREWTEDAIVLAGEGADTTTMTSVFCDVYDRFKDRLAASAFDLFQPED
jgi:hypothetical protein